MPQTKNTNARQENSENEFLADIGIFGLGHVYFWFRASLFLVWGSIFGLGFYFWFGLYFWFWASLFLVWGSIFGLGLYFWFRASLFLVWGPGLPIFGSRPSYFWFRVFVFLAHFWRTPVRNWRSANSWRIGWFEFLTHKNNQYYRPFIGRAKN